MNVTCRFLGTRPASQSSDFKTSKLPRMESLSVSLWQTCLALRCHETVWSLPRELASGTPWGPTVTCCASSERLSGSEFRDKVGPQVLDNGWHLGLLWKCCWGSEKWSTQPWSPEVLADRQTDRVGGEFLPARPCVSSTSCAQDSCDRHAPLPSCPPSGQHGRWTRTPHWELQCPCLLSASGGCSAE